MSSPAREATVQAGKFGQDRRHAAANLFTAINMLNLGILVVDHEARITVANCSAQDLLQPSGGASVSLKPSADGSLPLAAAVENPLIALVVPCHGEGEPSSLVFVSDPTAAPDVDFGQIAGLYGLTPAETRLLKALLHTDTIRAYAKRTGISLNTVKGHLHKLFRKTRTSRQTELVVRVLANPIFRLAGVRPTPTECSEATR